MKAYWPEAIVKADASDPELTTVVSTAACPLPAGWPVQAAKLPPSKPSVKYAPPPAPVPVPLRGTPCGLPAALSATLNVAVSAAALDGVKVTEIVQLAPAASVLGPIGQVL